MTSSGRQPVPPLEQAGVAFTQVVMNAYRHGFNEICQALGTATGRLAGWAKVRRRRVEAADGLLDPDADVNVVFGHIVFQASTLVERLGARPYVVYQLESLTPGNPIIRADPGYLALLRGARRVWDYAPANVARLRALGIEAVDLVPLGADDALAMPPPAAPDGGADAAEGPPLDALFYGVLTPRRRRLGAALARQGLRVAFRERCYGAERDALIRRAKVVLNIHQFDTLRTLEEARLSYLLANERFVISESAESDPYDGGVIFADYTDLPAVVRDWCARTDEERAAVAARGRRALMARPLAAPLEQALHRAVTACAGS
jgi:hypothetical protein